MQIDDLPSYTVIIAATNHAELLDRAAWRRFQLRLELPVPDETRLTQYFEAFMKQLDQPLGYSPSAIAKKLGRISYAEAEQFCLDVRRRHVLAMGEKPLKVIVSDQLKAWDALVPTSCVRKERGSA
jgi:AAA+ superfamily predicted ATPase